MRRREKSDGERDVSEILSKGNKVNIQFLKREKMQKNFPILQHFFR